MSDDLLRDLGRSFRRSVAAETTLLEPMDAEERLRTLDAAMAIVGGGARASDSPEVPGTSIDRPSLPTRLDLEARAQEEGPTDGRQDGMCSAPGGSDETARSRGWVLGIAVLVAAVIALCAGVPALLGSNEPLPPYRWRELDDHNAATLRGSLPDTTTPTASSRLSLSDTISGVLTPQTPVRRPLDIYLLAEPVVASVDGETMAHTAAQRLSVRSVDGDDVTPGGLSSVILGPSHLLRSPYGALRVQFAPGELLSLRPGPYQLHLVVVPAGTSPGSGSALLALEDDPDHRHLVVPITIVP